MSNYKWPSILSHVERSIGAVNNIIVTLQQEDILSSDILQANYPQQTVNEFVELSTTVVESLRSASSLTSDWLRETGDNLSTNVNETRRVEEDMMQNIYALHEGLEVAKASENRIHVLELAIQAGNSDLSSAQRTLDHARGRLRRQERTRKVVRVGAIAAFFAAPVVGVALAAIDITAFRRTIDQQEATIRTVNGQLSAARTQLQSQQETLLGERAEISRLSSKIADLTWRADDLAEEGRGLDSARTNLVELSTRINDCLHTVNAALSSSATISEMCFMRSVVTGIRGVVAALGADDMFAGPLAQLNDAALGSLDRRVAAIRRHQLAM